VLVSARAARELEEAIEWYNEEKPGLGRAFARTFRAATAVLRENPFLYPIAYSDFRRMTLAHFPYSILFDIRGNLVVIGSCFHQSRDPSEWEDEGGSD
jgi:plasmid stabilization system protein ParE